MTRTVIESKTKTVIIGFDEPFCVIGERINPTGRKKLAAELEMDNFDTVIRDALEQVACGANVLDVNSGAVFTNRMAADPRYASNAARVENRVALGADLAALFATAPAAHWLSLFDAAGVPAGPINSVTQALAHPVAAARGMRIELEGIPMVGSPLNLSDSPRCLDHAPPALGQHSDEIARECGLEPAALRAAGVLR